MKHWRVWVGIAVSLASLYWAARGVDFRSLAEALGRVRYVRLVAALAVFVLGQVARAYRWRLLLYPLEGLRLSRLFNVLNIGAMVNNVSPFRLGDVLKAYLCAELEQLSAARALSTVGVERIADTLTIVFLLVLLIPSISLPATLAGPTVGVGVVAVVAVLVLLFVAAHREQSLALFDRLLQRYRFRGSEWLRGMVNSAVDGLACLGSPRTAAGVLAWSAVIWVGAALQFHLVMWAADLTLPFAAALTALCLTSLGMVVPSSPGYVGVFESLTIVALSLFDVGRDVALSYALVLHAFGYLGLGILGVLGLWLEGYSYAGLRTVVGRTRGRVEST